MKILALLVMLVFGVPAVAQTTVTKDTPPASAALASGLYEAAPGPFGVKTIDQKWHDPSRNREVPVRIYIPQAKGGNDAGKLPVLVFSHGLGGSGMMYQYFGQHMASYGYIVIAPTHHGSDTEALLRYQSSATKKGKGWLVDSINDPDNMVNRPRDISFVLDEAPKHNEIASLLDMSRIGVAGHSFGAYTAMAIGGMTVDLPDDHGGKARSFRDTRVKAVLPMSPEGSGTMGITPNAWNSFTTPVLFLTGTKDYGSGGRSASWRQEAFGSVKSSLAFIVTLNDATHMTFGRGAGAKDVDLKVLQQGSPEGETLRDKVRERMIDRMKGKDDKPASPEATEALQKHHSEMIDALCSAFFDGYVKDDPQAKAWLDKFCASKHDDCTAETKQKK